VEKRAFKVIVIGGGHAGIEAAWAAANVLGEPGSVALVTIDPSKIGVMSCNPAIGGLAKGQLVREVDALGGLMGLAADATGIQFKVLNTSRGAAVHGPRAQCDKHAYAEEIQRLIASRPEIEVVAGTVERFVVEGGRVTGVVVAPAATEPRPSGSGGARGTNERKSADNPRPRSLTVLCELKAPAVVLTTGTFMRGLMHTGESRTEGGRFGEAAATGISGALKDMGFELGRLKTGTPPRLKRATIDWEGLEAALGDAKPVAFSELNSGCGECGWVPELPQVECRQTQTTAEIHELIRANLHRAPMYTGQIESVGPRYCPSIEDKVVRFAERESHTVFLEPESLRPPHDDWVYCNGISTSLPADVQDRIVRAMPGCDRAEIYRYGYAVEYDMVRPHQIHATGMTKLVHGLFLAGQINGTSGYEEAAGQGLIAGINAARLALGLGEFVLRRDQAYIGVMMDDLITKTPVEPYRMFTSRAEHRLLLRPDNAPDRLTPLAMDLGLLGAPHGGGHGRDLGRLRWELFERRREQMAEINAAIDAAREGGPGGGSLPLGIAMRRPEFGLADLKRKIGDRPCPPGVWATILADRKYESYVARQRSEIKRASELETKKLPATIDYTLFGAMRPEARQALVRFRPGTFGQAGRLEGITPADLTLLAVLLKKSAGTPR